MADASFDFSTNIDKTAKKIQSGLNRIASDLSAQRGGRIDMFDGIASAAEQAAKRANKALATVGTGLGKEVVAGRRTSGQDDLSKAYRQLRDQATKDVTAAGKAAGLSTKEISSLSTPVRASIKSLFDEIAKQLRAAESAAVRIPSARIREIARLEALPKQTQEQQRTAARLRTEEGLPKRTVDPTAATKMVKDFEAVYKPLVRAAEKAGYDEASRRLYAQVKADPSFQKVPGGATAAGVAYRNTAAGGLERLPPADRRADEIFAKAERARDVARQAAVKQQQSESLLRSFVGGLTSGGFGGNNTDFSGAGLARSFGTSVKFYAQYQVLQLIKRAFSDTVAEAVDYRDSLTDLNVALGASNSAGADYVGTLTDIARVAGANVGEALDSAARGVRAFTSSTDTTDTKKQAGEDFARAASRAAIITSKGLKDVRGDVIAIATSFEVGSDRLQSINDVLSGSKLFGGDPSQVSQGLANGGIALKEAGFSLSEAGAVLSLVTARLDQSGQTTASRLSRITGALSDAGGRALISDLGIDPNSSQRDQLLALSNGYDSFNRSQQDAIKSKLGGISQQRELQVLLNELSKGDIGKGFEEGFDNGGKGAAEFRRKSEDLAGTLREIKGTLSAIQTSSFDAGVFAPFSVALLVLEPLLTTVNDLLTAYNRLFSALSGVVDFIPGGATAVKVGKNLLALYLELKLARAVLAAFARAGATQAAAEGVAATAAAEAKVEGSVVATEAVAVETRARWLNVAAMRAEAVLGAGRIGAILPGRGATAVEGTAKAGLFSGFAGKASLAILGVVALDGVVRELGDSAQEASTAVRSSATALELLAKGDGSKALRDTAAALRASAKENDKASSGISGNTVDFIAKHNRVRDFLQGIPVIGIPFGKVHEGDSERQAKSDRQGAKILDRRAAEVAAKEAEFQRLGVSASFGDVRNVENVKSGLEQLTGVGVDATERLRLLVLAMRDIGKEDADGLIQPGGGVAFGKRIGDQYVKLLQESLADSILAGQGKDVPKLRRMMDEAKRRVTRDQEQYERVRTDPNASERDLTLAKNALDESKDTVKWLEGDRKKAFDEAGRTLSLDTAESAELQTAVSSVVENFIKGIGLESSGGVLTPQQIDDLAGQLAPLYVSRGLAKDIAGAQKYLKERLLKHLAEDSNIENLIIDATTNEEYGKILSDEAGQSASGAELRALAGGKGDAQAKYQGAAANLAGVLEAARVQAATPFGVTKAQQLRVLQASKDLVDARTAALKESIELTNAQELVGVDPRDTRGHAAAAVNAARRALTVAKPGLEFYQAQAALLKAQQDYADEITEEQTTALYNNIDPRDTLALAHADVQKAQMELKALRAGQTSLGPLTDYDTQGNPVGTAPDFLAEGEGNGTTWVKGLNKVDYFTEGVSIGTKLMAGITSGTEPQQPPPPATPGTGTHRGVIGEDDRGRPIIGNVPNASTAYTGATNQSAAILGVLGASGLRYSRADGSTVVRNVHGTDKPSQHSYGNAVDIFGSKSELTAIVNYFMKFKTGLKELIYTPTGTFLGAGGKPFNPSDITRADHVGHVHVSVNDPAAFDRALKAQGATVQTTGSSTGAGNTAAADKKAQEVAAKQLAERQALLDNSVAQLQGVSDPNNSLEQARLNLDIANRTLKIQLPFSTGYYQALTQVHATQLALSNALNDRQSAREGAEAARYGGPLAAAAATLSEAKRNFAAQAPRTAEYYRTQAALFNAQRASAQAQLEYSALLLTLSGDITNPLVQAQNALRVARRKLREDTAKKATPDVLAADQLDVRQAEATAEQTAFQQRLSDAQTNEELGRISHVAYIRYLQSEHDRLTLIKDKTYQQQQELNTIDQALKAANEQLQGQFNLGDINIPTPYDVRRRIAEQVAVGMGAGSSSSTQTVYITINGNDPAAMQNTLMRVIGPAAFQRSTVSTAKV